MFYFVSIPLRTNATEDGCRRTTSAPLWDGATPRTRLRTVRECRTDRFFWWDRLLLIFRTLRVRRLLVYFMMICHFSARLDFLVPILSKIVPLGIRVKTLITVSFILYLPILLALFKRKVVPPLQANNINRFHVFGTIFECFIEKTFSKVVFDFWILKLYVLI